MWGFNGTSNSIGKNHVMFLDMVPGPDRTLANHWLVLELNVDLNMLQFVVSETLATNKKLTSKSTIRNEFYRAYIF